MNARPSPFSIGLRVRVQVAVSGWRWRPALSGGGEATVQSGTGFVWELTDGLGMRGRFP